jgi:hypothetical protein
MHVWECFAMQTQLSIFLIMEDTVGVVCLAMLVDRDRIQYQEIGLQKRRFYLRAKFGWWTTCVEV